MVMDLLGPNLEDLFAHYKRKFSLKTVIQLGDQMVHISVIDFLASKNRIYSFKELLAS